MLLEAKGISKSFGGLSAVSEVDLTIGQEELVSIIGPNGAGKSTLFNLITGHIRPDKGTVTYKGEDITGRKPYDISRLGIGRSFQKLNIFPPPDRLSKRSGGLVLGPENQPQALCRRQPHVG